MTAPHRKARPAGHACHVRRARRARRRGLAALLALLAGCVSYEPAVLTPAITLAPERLSMEMPAGTAPTAKLRDFGLDLGRNESDSLFNVETLPGVRVRGLTPNGAAAAAGLAVGDVILAIDGLPTNHPDAILALERQPPAADSAAPQTFAVRLRRATRVLEAQLTPRPLAVPSEPVELFRIDPLVSRAGYDTQLVAIDGKPGIAAARIVEFYPDSPLPAAGLRSGDAIIALDGAVVSGAQDFINRLHRDAGFGATVTLEVYDGETVERVRIRLWDPGRRLNRLSLGPLLRYESSLAADRSRFAILDLWLFSLYSYRREGSERTHSVLGLFHFGSDLGTLTEVTE